MWERIKQIIHKESRQTLRDPRSRALLIGPPLIQLLIFGYAVNMDVEGIRIAWMDQDRTYESRALLSALQGSRQFVVTAELEREDQIAEALDRGKIEAVVRIQPGFARNIYRGNTAEVQILVDGTNSNTAAIASNYISQAALRYAGAVQEEQRNARVMARAGNNPVPAGLAGLNVQNRVWFNPELRSRVYFVPGVIVNIIALVTIMLTAMSIVREKEIGTMEQLMVTPLRPIEHADIPRPVSRQRDAALRERLPVPAHISRPRPLHFHHLPHPAAGHDVYLLLFYARADAERLQLSHPQHAAARPVPDLSQSPALFHGDRARHPSQRHRHRVPMAPDAGVVFLRNWHSLCQRAALPQAPRLSPPDAKNHEIHETHEYDF
jgi:hypothetical protein